MFFEIIFTIFLGFFLFLSFYDLNIFTLLTNVKMSEEKTNDYLRTLFTPKTKNIFATKTNIYKTNYNLDIDILANKIYLILEDRKIAFDIDLDQPKYLAYILN